MCGSQSPIDGTYQIANILSTGSLENMFQKLYVFRLMMRVLPRMMIKLYTAMSQHVIRMIKGQFKFNSAIYVYKVLTIISPTFP